MPKRVQTLLQVQERQRREQRLRTEARCAQLAAQAKLRVTVRDNLEEVSDDEDNTSIEQHGNGKVPHRERRELRLTTEGRGAPRVAEGKLRVTVLVNHQVLSDDEDIVHIELDGNVPQRFKGWKPCIDLTCGFLLLLAANCLVLQYFLFYKAKSV